MQLGPDYFNYSNMPTLMAVTMADMLRSGHIGPLWLLGGAKIAQSLCKRKANNSARHNTIVHAGSKTGRARGLDRRTSIPKRSKKNSPAGHLWDR